MWARAPSLVLLQHGRWRTSPLVALRPVALAHEREASAHIHPARLNAALNPEYNSANFKQEAFMAETRKVIDCRQFPAEKPCSIAISGTEEEVMNLAVLHAGTVHGHADSPELREQIRSMLQDESTASKAA